MSIYSQIQILQNCRRHYIIILFTKIMTLNKNYKKHFRKSRTTFDTSETRRQFGPIVIDYAKVQSKVALKYDSLEKEILAKFGGLLGIEMQTFHGHISKVDKAICIMKQIFAISFPPV